jgi:hypothetical protein
MARAERGGAVDFARANSGHRQLLGAYKFGVSGEKIGKD